MNSNDVADGKENLGALVSFEGEEERSNLGGEEDSTIINSLSEQDLHRLSLIQKLIAAQEMPNYGLYQQEIAKELGITVRSVRRLLQRYRLSGIAGIVAGPRRDQGTVKIDSEWQDFIVKTYTEGNRGSKQMSPAQVAVRVKVRASELGVSSYPSHMSVYRILNRLKDGQQQKRTLGWRDDCLILKTREGLSIPVEWSNQVWQCDHTQVDVLVVDQTGEVLGRPWLTIVVDTYSRCLMGMHLGFDAPSSSVVCLALRHAILPKQYSSAYELKQMWGTYGLPQYLYTDRGKDFRSQHLEQVAATLGIVLCLRRKPSDGGIVERPFGTFNREFFSLLPGYTGSDVTSRSPEAETEACLSLNQLEQLLVRYMVDNYNLRQDARMCTQTRIGRWEAGRIAQLPLIGERELDICLMRRDRRRVYRSGYILFANLTYSGEHLAAYAGELVIVRYNPRDITTILIYQQAGSTEVFLGRAHALGWETEVLSLAEAQAISKRRRIAADSITNSSYLEEIRERDRTVKELQRHSKHKGGKKSLGDRTCSRQKSSQGSTQRTQMQQSISQPREIHGEPNKSLTENLNAEQVLPPGQVMTEVENSEKPAKPVPYVKVYDYEELKRGALW